jgi:hypothetical protein
VSLRVNSSSAVDIDHAIRVDRLAPGTYVGSGTLRYVHTSCAFALVIRNSRLYSRKVYDGISQSIGRRASRTIVMSRFPPDPGEVVTDSINSGEYASRNTAHEPRRRYASATPIL